MGAWGSGNFENDTAFDWAADVSSVDDVRRPFDRLKRDTDARKGKSPRILDADFGCELLAAAECVAFMLDRPSRDFPQNLADRLRNAGKPDNLLFHQARNAVLYTMRHSELAELWEETARDSGANEWLVVLTDLIERLNPELEPPTTGPGRLPRSPGAPTDIVGTCAFCDGPIERQQLWSMHVDDAYEPGRARKKGFSLHLRCLNARLHHKHAIADMKFDPDNMPDLDKL